MVRRETAWGCTGAAEAMVDHGELETVMKQRQPMTERGDNAEICWEMRKHRKKTIRHPWEEEDLIPGAVLISKVLCNLWSSFSLWVHTLATTLCPVFLCVCSEWVSVALTTSIQLKQKCTNSLWFPVGRATHKQAHEKNSPFFSTPLVGHHSDRSGVLWWAQSIFSRLFVL